MSSHPREDLGAWLDGELDPDAARRVETHLRACSECNREVAVLRHLGGAMRDQGREVGTSVWEGVHRRITRPVGWLLVVAGIVIWAALAVLEWWRSEITVEWLAASAAIIGGALLFVGIAHEQYRDWQETRYKDVQL